MYDAVKCRFLFPIFHSDQQSYASYAKFKWTAEHQKCLEELVEAFSKDALVQYFDIWKPTFISTDAHVSGLEQYWHKGKISTVPDLLW